MWNVALLPCFMLAHPLLSIGPKIGRLKYLSFIVQIITGSDSITLSIIHKMNTVNVTILNGWWTSCCHYVAIVDGLHKIDSSSPLNQIYLNGNMEARASFLCKPSTTATQRRQLATTMTTILNGWWTSCYNCVAIVDGSHKTDNSSSLNQINLNGNLGALESFLCKPSSYNSHTTVGTITTSLGAPLA